jgi:hypothetical protein
LVVGEEREEIDVQEKTFCNDLLKELTTALEEANGSIGLGEAVVGLLGLREDNHLGIVPGVMSKGEGCIEQIGETIWLAGEGPFEKLVCDTRPARSGLI